MGVSGLGGWGEGGGDSGSGDWGGVCPRAPRGQVGDQ